MTETRNDSSAGSVAPVNIFQKTAYAFMALSALLAAPAGSQFSAHLQTRGLQALHAYTFFLGFGIFMALGRMIEVFDYKSGKQLYIATLACVTTALSGFIARDFLAGVLPFNPLFLPIAGGLLLSIRFAILFVEMFRENHFSSVFIHMNTRFFATSLFMLILACGQLAHICINMVSPALPFSQSLELKHNYLAFSFPLSLCVMGCVYLAIESRTAVAKSGIPPLWNAHYFLLVGGVFSLFFSILFSPWMPEGLPIKLAVFFSFILVVSALVFTYIIFRLQQTKSVFTSIEWRYYFCASLYLFAAGVIGMGLGYRNIENSPIHYFLLQGHIHIALAGWTAFGMSGALAGSFRRGAERLEKMSFIMIHAGLALYIAGIFARSIPLRTPGAILFAAAFIFQFSAVKKDAQSEVK